MQIEETTPAGDGRIPSTSAKIIFHGQGKELFSIMLINILLSIVTLGLYYPWAKAAYLKYAYSETEFNGSRFTFHGTGLEMFKGLVKAIVIISLFFGVIFYASMMKQPLIIIMMYIPFIFFLIPLAIVGSLKYRTSRSSWRGIHFGYSGTYKSMLKVHSLGVVFTILTFGIYQFWYITDLYKEILKNIRFGNLKFEFTGEGGQYFGKMFFGYLATIFTLGIYAFKWQSELHKYFIENIKVKIEGNNKVQGKFIANTTGWGFFYLQAGNLLILLFTLGIGMPWTLVRTLQYFAETTELKNRISFDHISQTETRFADATGEGFADALDFQLI